jgi:hypothetical protein
LEPIENMKKKIEYLLEQMDFEIEQIELETITYSKENGEMLERFVLVINGCKKIV